MKEGWKLKKMSDLFDIKSSKRVHKADWKTKGVPFYRAREVVKLAQNGYVDNDLFISEDLYLEFTKEKGAPKEGDIIISAVGTLGQCYLVKDSDIFYFKDASVLWFNCISNVNTRYIEYSFKSDLIIKQVLDKSMGATVGTLTISRAKNIKIPIPLLPEQKQIVSILDQAFAAIDQAKANIEKNIVNAKELFQSKLKEVFYQSGEGWEEKALGDIFTFRQGIQRGVKLQSETQTNGQVRFLRIIDYTQGHQPPRYIDNPGEQYIINENDISLVRYGASTGFVCKGFSGALANNLFRVITKDSFTISSNYLYYFLTSPVFQGYIKSKMNGAAMPAISFGMISKIPFPITRLQNQEKIATNISLIEVKTIELVSTFEVKIRALNELKKSILQKAFSGELTK